MVFETLVDVLTHKFVGNHAADQAAFTAIDDFVLRDDVTDQDRLQALNHITVSGMGLDPMTISDARRDLKNLRQSRDMRGNKNQKRK